MTIFDTIERADRLYRVTIHQRDDGHFYYVEQKLRQYGDAPSFYFGAPRQSGIFGDERDVRADVERQLEALDQPAELSRSDKRTRLVGMVLLHDWDPIGVREEPWAQDEYDQHVAPIVAMLLAGASPAELSEHLRDIQVRLMCLREPAPDAIHEVALKLSELVGSGPFADPPATGDSFSVRA